MRSLVPCVLLLAVFSFTACKHRPREVKAEKIDPIISTDDNGNELSDNQNLQIMSPLVGTVLDRSGELRPVFFDYDKADIRPDQIEVLQTNAQILRQLEVAKVQIQGHCDERGTEEYNLALGDRRARMVREYLSSMGIAPERLDTVSFGEARPFEKEHNEEAWRENRRAHFVEEHRN